MWYNHETETWVPAQVTVGGSGDVSVELVDTFGENSAAGMVSAPAAPAASLAAGIGLTDPACANAQEYTHPASDPVFMPMDESNLKPADDMVTLGDLHEAALLHNIRMRFYNDDIFTFIGPILVAANPYKMVPIFTGEFVSVRLPRPPLPRQPRAASPPPRGRAEVLRGPGRDDDAAARVRPGQQRLRQHGS